MSNFLGRMAARAVGSTAVAQPRLPALFEPGGLEVAESTTVARAPRPASVPRATASETERKRAPEIRAEREQVARPEVATQTRKAARAATPAAPPALATVTPAPGPAPTEPSEPDSPPSLAEAIASLTKQPVPATPALHGARRDAPPTPAATAAVRDQPPPVRVHIGRLEVRANLESPAPPPRPAEPAPQGLSLSDYLRGKRAAG